MWSVLRVQLGLMALIWCAEVLGKPPVDKVPAIYIPQRVKQDGRTTETVEDDTLLDILDKYVGAQAQRDPNLYRPSIKIVDGVIDIRGLSMDNNLPKQETENRATQAPPFDLRALKGNLKTEIQNIFRPNVQQIQHLNVVLDNAFNSIEKIFGTELTKRPGPDPKAKVCGNQMECVEIWMCRNSSVNANGAYSIMFRSSYKAQDCNYNQVCCHIADKLLTKPANAQNLKPNKCGYRNVNGVQLSIQGAQNNEANFGEFPWMVAILVQEDPLIIYIGGGSVLSDKVVLTAAHKIADRSEETLLVRAGEWDQRTTREIYDHQDIGVQLKIMHNRFDGNINNIALLYLRESFSSSPHISPICLPKEDQILDYSRCIVTGWGKSPQNSSFYHNILKRITVPVLPRAMCNAKLRPITQPQFSLHDSYICAGGEKGIDSCHGDGGAPLVCPIQGSPNRYVQAGIVAWGIGCGLENVPAAYTNVAYLMPWLERELNKLDCTFFKA